MSGSASVRRLAPEEWRTYRELRLRALADAPEAFGATLAKEQTRSDEEWANRLACAPDSDLPLVAEVDGVPAGLAWGKIEDSPDTAHVYQMWVAPPFRGMGIGHMLLVSIIEWAAAAGVHWLVLSVAIGNTAATRVYERAGFVPIGEPGQICDGSQVVAQAMRLRISG